MERHPGVHWNMHATGILWEWLERHHADYVDRVAEQVKAGPPGDPDRRLL